MKERFSIASLFAMAAPDASHRTSIDAVDRNELLVPRRVWKHPLRNFTRPGLPRRFVMSRHRFGSDQSIRSIVYIITVTLHPRSAHPSISEEY
jgi:hypothetical protein